MSFNTLVMPMKVPPRYDLVHPLSQWLDGDQQVGFGSKYSTPNLNISNPLQLVVPKPSFKSKDCRSELLRLAALRNCLSEALMDSHQSAMDERALADCQDYHATLLAFERQGFPSMDDELNGINLTWKGAFATAQHETHHSLVWDRACTMWNVSALESFVASMCDLSTKEGCKKAVASLQSAAGVLALLRELVQSDDYATVDFSVGMLTFWEKVLLAQGQVAIYRMANLGDQVRQHSVLGYLIKAAANLYNEALTQAQDPRLQSEVPRQAQEWGAKCKALSMMQSAKAEFHLAVDHRQQKQHGMEIARLTQCLEYAKQCRDFVSSASVHLPEIESLYKLAKDRLQTIKAENHALYQDDVPRSVSDIAPKQFIKAGLPLPESMIIPKVNLFVGK